MKKSNLDEMQEQKLLQLERNGCWLAFHLLLAAILIQAIFGAAFWQLLGECAILLTVSIYMCIGCLRHGIWDRRFKPDLKTNLLFSVAAGAFIAAFAYAMVCRQTDDLRVIAVSIVISAGAVFLLCFAALTLCSRLYRKRRRELDTE